MKVGINNHVLSAAYRPRRFDGELLLFVSTAGVADIAGKTRDSVAAWQPYVAGPVTTHPVHAHHGHLLQPEPAAEIGRVVLDKLASQLTSVN